MIEMTLNSLGIAVPLAAMAPPPPPVATVALPTGVTLTYREQGRGDGEPVILLHGYTDSAHSYARVLPLLPPELHVFTLDQRGHGASSKPDSSYGVRTTVSGARWPTNLGDSTKPPKLGRTRSYAMHDFAADVIAFLDAMQIEKATIVGHSMGSLIGQLVAIDQPDRVTRLVLIGSTVNARTPDLLAFNAVVQTLADPIDPAFVRDFQVSTIHGEVPTAFVDKVIAESQKAPASVWRQAAAGLVQHNPVVDLPRITAPTLILWGDQDGVFTRSDQAALTQAIPNTTLLVYPEAGHALHWEQPVQVAADLVQFMKATYTD